MFLPKKWHDFQFATFIYSLYILIFFLLVEQNLGNILQRISPMFLWVKSIDFM